MHPFSTVTALSHIPAVKKSVFGISGSDDEDGGSSEGEGMAVHGCAGNFRPTPNMVPCLDGYVGGIRAPNIFMSVRRSDSLDGASDPPNPSRAFTGDEEEGERHHRKEKREPQFVAEDLSQMKRVVLEDWARSIGAVHEFPCNEILPQGAWMPR